MSSPFDGLASSPFLSSPLVSFHVSRAPHLSPWQQTMDSFHGGAAENCEERNGDAILSGVTGAPATASVSLSLPRFSSPLPPPSGDPTLVASSSPSFAFAVSAGPVDSRPPPTADLPSLALLTATPPDPLLRAIGPVSAASSRGAACSRASELSEHPLDSSSRLLPRAESGRARGDCGVLSQPSVAESVSTCVARLHAAHAEGEWAAIARLEGDLRRALLLPASCPPPVSPRRQEAETSPRSAVWATGPDGWLQGLCGEEGEPLGGVKTHVENPETADASVSLLAAAPLSPGVLASSPSDDFADYAKEEVGLLAARDSRAVSPGRLDPASRGSWARDPPGSHAPAHAQALFASPRDEILGAAKTASPQSSAYEKALLAGGADGRRSSSPWREPLGCPGSAHPRAASLSGAGRGPSASFSRHPSKHNSSAFFHQLRLSLAAPGRSVSRLGLAGAESEAEDEAWDEAELEDLIAAMAEREARGREHIRARRLTRLAHDARLAFYAAAVDAALHLRRFAAAEAHMKELLGGREAGEATRASGVPGREACAGGRRHCPLASLGAFRRARAAQAAAVRRAQAGGPSASGRGEMPSKTGNKEAGDSVARSSDSCEASRAQLQSSSGGECDSPMPAFSLLPFLHSSPTQGREGESHGAPAELSRASAAASFPPLDVWLLWLKTLLRVASFNELHEALGAAPPTAIWALVRTFLPSSGTSWPLPSPESPSSGPPSMCPLELQLSLLLSAAPPPVPVACRARDAAVTPSSSARPAHHFSSTSRCDGRHADWPPSSRPFVFLSPFFFFRKFARLPLARQLLVLEALAAMGLLCGLAQLHSVAAGLYELLLLLSYSPGALAAKQRCPRLPVAAAARLLRLQEAQAAAQPEALLSIWSDLRHVPAGLGAGRDADEASVSLFLRGLPRCVEASQPSPSLGALFLALLPSFLAAFWDSARHCRRLASLASPLGTVLEFADVQYLACRHSRLCRPLPSEFFFALSTRCCAQLGRSRPARGSRRETSRGRNASPDRSFRITPHPSDAARQEGAAHHLAVGGVSASLAVSSPFAGVSGGVGQTGGLSGGGGSAAGSHGATPSRQASHGTVPTPDPGGSPGARVPHGRKTTFFQHLLSPREYLLHGLHAGMTGDTGPRGGETAPTLDGARLTPALESPLLVNRALLASLQLGMRRGRSDAVDGGLVRGLLADPLTPLDRETLVGLGKLRRRAWLAMLSLLLGSGASLSTLSSRERRLAYVRLQQRELVVAQLRGAVSAAAQASAGLPAAHGGPLGTRGVAALPAAFQGGGDGGTRDGGYAFLYRGFSRLVLQEQAVHADANAQSPTATLRSGSHESASQATPRARGRRDGSHYIGDTLWKARRSKCSSSPSPARDEGLAERPAEGLRERDPPAKRARAILWRTWRLTDESEEEAEWASVFVDPHAPTPSPVPIGGSAGPAATDALAAQISSKLALRAAGRVYAEAARTLYVSSSLLSFLPACVFDARFFFSLQLEQLKEFENYRAMPFKQGRLAKLLALCCCRGDDASGDPVKLFAAATVCALRRQEKKAQALYRSVQSEGGGLLALGDGSGGAYAANTAGGDRRSSARDRGNGGRWHSKKEVVSGLAEASREAARAVAWALEAQSAQRVERPGDDWTSAAGTGVSRSRISHAVACAEPKGRGRLAREHRLDSGGESAAPVRGEIVPAGSPGLAADAQHAGRGLSAGEEEDGDVPLDEDEAALLWGGGTRTGSAVINSLLAFLVDAADMYALLLLPYASYSTRSGEPVFALRLGHAEDAEAAGVPSPPPAPPQAWTGAALVKCGLRGRAPGGDESDAGGALGEGVALPQLAGLLEQTVLLSLSSKMNEPLLRLLLERLALTQLFQGNFFLALAALEQIEERGSSTLRSFEDAKGGLRLMDEGTIALLFGEGNAGRFSSGFLSSVKAKLLLVHLQRPIAATLALTRALADVAASSAQRQRRARVAPGEAATRLRPAAALEQQTAPPGTPRRLRALPAVEAREGAEVLEGVTADSGTQGASPMTAQEQTKPETGASREKPSSPCPGGRRRLVRRSAFRSLRPPSSAEREDATTLALLLLLGQASLLQARQTRLFALPPGLLPAEPLPFFASSSTPTAAPVPPHGAPPAESRAPASATSGGAEAESAKASSASSTAVAAASRDPNEAMVKFRFGDERHAEICTYPSLVNRAFRCGASALALRGGLVDPRVWGLLAWTAMQAFDLPACAEFARKSLLLDRRDTRVWLLLAWAQSGRLPVLAPSLEALARDRAEGQGGGDWARTLGTGPAGTGPETPPAPRAPCKEDDSSSAPAQGLGQGYSRVDSACAPGSEPAIFPGLTAGQYRPPPFPVAPVLNPAYVAPVQVLAGRGPVGASAPAVEAGLLPFLAVVESALEEHPTSLSLVIAKTWTQARHSPLFRLFTFGESLGPASPSQLPPLHAYCPAAPSESDGLEGLATLRCSERQPRGMDQARADLHRPANNVANGETGVSTASASGAGLRFIGEAKPAAVEDGIAAVSRRRVGTTVPASVDGAPRTEAPCGVSLGGEETAWEVTSASNSNFASCGLFWRAEERRHTALNMDTPGLSSFPELGLDAAEALLESESCSSADSSTSEDSSEDPDDDFRFASDRRATSDGAEGREREEWYYAAERRPTPSAVSGASKAPLESSLLKTRRARQRKGPHDFASARSRRAARLLSVQTTLQQIEGFFAAVERESDPSRFANSSAATQPFCIRCCAAQHVHLLPCAMHALQRLSAELATVGLGYAPFSTSSGVPSPGAGGRLTTGEPSISPRGAPADRGGLACAFLSAAQLAASGATEAAARQLSHAEGVMRQPASLGLAAASGERLHLAQASTLVTACVLHDCAMEPLLRQQGRRGPPESPAQILRQRQKDLQQHALGFANDPYSPFYSRPRSSTPSGDRTRPPPRRPEPVGAACVIDAKHLERETVGWMALVELLCHLRADSACVWAALHVAELYLHYFRGVAAPATVELHVGGAHAAEHGPRGAGARRGRSGRDRDPRRAEDACDSEPSGPCDSDAARGLSGRTEGGHRQPANGGEAGHTPRASYSDCGRQGPRKPDPACARCGAACAAGGREAFLHFARMRTRSPLRARGAAGTGTSNSGLFAPGSGTGWQPGELLGVKIEFLRLYAEYFYIEDEAEEARAEAPSRFLPRFPQRAAKQQAYFPGRLTSTSPSEGSDDFCGSNERPRHYAPHSRASSPNGGHSQSSRSSPPNPRSPHSPRCRRSVRPPAWLASRRRHSVTSAAAPLRAHCHASWGSRRSGGRNGDSLLRETLLPREDGEEGVPFAGVTAAAAVSAALAEGARGPPELSRAGDRCGAWAAGLSGVADSSPRSCRSLSLLLEKVQSFRKLHPFSRPAQLLEARLLYRQTDLGKALALLRGLLTLDTQELCLDGDTDFLQESLGVYLYGKCLQALGQFDPASRAFDRAMRLYFHAPMMKAGLIEVNETSGPGASLVG
ncbi:hypothetical protein BESB_003330 [Besnoitia besnoiti]|uniref:Tetratricopeptide repeat-containing protein n=1 Tax=Besnoitia besnoiti TaxID=94643 RepID=A0A2A9MQ12_BESBE|nr:hypothetical protein BESB_003330 [Besnoitia besnoiti]PFH37992.1 hypothetical protein BESB_003330 [Besnoitia besnoiti]